MEFFNKKEEVLEIKLTQYGKRLYADGKLLPKYYAFFDDDIIYDTEWAGFSEAAHSASARIKEAPRMKIQSALYGIETDINKKIESIRRTNGNIAPENLQQIKEKSYVLVNALGKSDTTKDYAPAWDIRSYKNKILSNSRTINDSGKLNEVVITQINMEDLNYKIKAIDKPDFNADVFGHTFEDGTALTIDTTDGEMLVGLRESNSPLSNDKFEIEVYMVNEENGVENLVPLYFRDKKDKIVNDILLDDTEEEDVVIDETYAERYMNIESDMEIDPEFLRDALGPSATASEAEEIRTFGISGQFLSDEDLPISGLVGSEETATLNPDEIASMSGKFLKDLELKSSQMSSGKTKSGKSDKQQISKESIYNKVPKNIVSETCDGEE